MELRLRFTFVPHQMFLDISGEYFYNSKISKTSNGANNSQDADRLWDISLQLTGLI